jgi:hypothetical protein
MQVRVQGVVQERDKILQFFFVTFVCSLQKIFLHPLYLKLADRLVPMIRPAANQ